MGTEAGEGVDGVVGDGVGAVDSEGRSGVAYVVSCVLEGNGKFECLGLCDSSFEKECRLGLGVGVENDAGEGEHHACCSGVGGDRA